MIPTRCVTIRDEAGVPCTPTQGQQERWKRHFTKVLNVQSQFSVSEVDKVRQRSSRPQLEELPSMEDYRGHSETQGKKSRWKLRHFTRNGES